MLAKKDNTLSFESNNLYLFREHILLLFSGTQQRTGELSSASIMKM